MSMRYADLSALYNSPQTNKSIVICSRMLLAEVVGIVGGGGPGINSSLGFLFWSVTVLTYSVVDHWLLLGDCRPWRFGLGLASFFVQL